MLYIACVWRLQQTMTRKKSKHLWIQTRSVGNCVLVKNLAGKAQSLECDSQTTFFYFEIHTEYLNVLKINLFEYAIRNVEYCFIWSFPHSFINFCTLIYLELVHPIWHRVNFKLRWVYITFALIWLSNLMNETYQIATSKVMYKVYIIFLSSYIYH